MDRDDKEQNDSTNVEKIWEIGTILWAQFLANPDARHELIQEAEAKGCTTIISRGQILWKKQDISS